MTRWQFQTRQFLLPKSGHSLTECEDAIGIDARSARFAVADGATEAFAARSWAEELAHNWVQTEPAVLTSADFRVWIAERGRWLHDSWKGLPFSWYSEEKASTGSFAAFVGVQFEVDSAAPSWRGIALGDSCLIHCRNNQVLQTLPRLNAASFNSMPCLVPSHCGLQEAALERVSVDSGGIEPEGKFLLLSDAAAAWYLTLAEQDDPTRACFDGLLARGHESELTQLFDSERTSGRIKDDDIAIIGIEVRP